MDSIRYFLALVLLSTLPPAFLFWFFVHPFIGFWRRVGAAGTYTVNMAVFAVVLGSIVRLREPLLAVEYGTNWLLVGLGLALYAAAGAVERACRRYLTLRTLLGVPEIKAPDEGPGKLLNEGIYAHIRHPRYLGILLGGTGIALIGNYRAAYLLMLALIPVAFALTVIEERELVGRFGDAYREYRGSTSRFIPASSAVEFVRTLYRG